MLGRTWWRRLGLEKMKKRKKTGRKIRRYAFVRLNIFRKMMIWEEGGDPEMKQKWRSRIVLSVLWQKRLPLGVRSLISSKKWGSSNVLHNLCNFLQQTCWKSFVSFLIILPLWSSLYLSLSLFLHPAPPLQKSSTHCCLVYLTKYYQQCI